MTLFPTEAEVAEIRADAEQLLPGICQILTLTETPDGAGGINETWIPGSDTACRLAPVETSRASGTVADRIDERTTNVITLPAGTAVTTSDRISLDGRVWAVTAKRERTIADSFVVRVEVREVD